MASMDLSDYLLRDSFTSQDEYFRIIADYTYDWEYLLLPDKRLGYVSPSCKRITGYNAQNFLTSPELLIEIVHPKDKASFSLHMDNILRNIKVSSLEFRIIDRNGNEHWIGQKSQPVFLENGEYLGCRISNREISDTKIAEKKVQTSLRRFRQFVANSNDGILLVNTLGEVCEWNKSQEKITGIKQSEVIGEPFWIVRSKLKYSNEDQKFTHEFNEDQILELLKTGKGKLVNRTLEWVIDPKNERNRYIQERYFSITTEEGFQLGCITRDITEIKKSSLELEMIVENRTRQLQKEIITRQQAEAELTNYFEIEHTLLKISRIFIQNQNLQETIPLVLQRIASVTKSDNVTLYVNNKSGNCIETIFEWITSREVSRRSNPISLTLENLFFFCIDKLWAGRNIHISDCDISDETYKLENHRTVFPDHTSVILIPIISNQDYLGVLRFDYVEKNNKSGVERNDRFLEILAQIISGALERGKIMDILERQVKDRTQDIHILYEIASLVSKPNDVVGILKSSLDLLMNSSINIGAGFIHFQGNENEEYNLVYCSNLIESSIKMISFRSISNNLREKIINTNRPIIIPDLRKQSEIPIEICMDRYYSYIGIPIWVKGRLIGVLSLLGDNFDQLTLDNITLLTAVGDQIGGAIEGEQLRARAKEAAVIEERQRLARELHDSVTQYLYSLTLLTKGWQREVDTANPNEIKQWLEHASDITGIALKEMRLLLYALHPQTMLDREGLIGSINRYLEKIESQGIIKTYLTVDSNIHLPQNIEYELFRIVQESLTNVVKHSQATNITVSIKDTRDYVEFQVKDNGVGFDLDDLAKGKGLGITLMHERANDIKSTFSIDSKPGNGTKITIRVNTTQFAS